MAELVDALDSGFRGKFSRDASWLIKPRFLEIRALLKLLFSGGVWQDLGRRWAFAVGIFNTR